MGIVNDNLTRCIIKQIDELCPLYFQQLLESGVIKRGEKPKLDELRNYIEIHVSPLLIINKRGAYAFAQYFLGGYSEKFLVFKGSEFCKDSTPSMDVGRKKLLNRLIREGKIIEADRKGYWVASDSINFNSPSEAASLVAGSNLNGLIAWEVKSSALCLRDWLAIKDSEKKWAIKFELDWKKFQ